MDVIPHSEIGTQNAMTEVSNHIQVLLSLTGRSEHFCPQYNECAMDMKAEMGSSRKAMIRAGTSFNKSSNEQKQRIPLQMEDRRTTSLQLPRSGTERIQVAQRPLVADE